MRLPIFMIASILLALAALVVSLITGAPFGSAALNGILTLIALQVIYALYLAILAARARRERKPPQD